VQALIPRRVGAPSRRSVATVAALIGTALLWAAAAPGLARAAHTSRAAQTPRAAQASLATHTAGPQLRVGVGRADITPVTGVFKGGWSCTCAEAIGQQERLYARVVVIDEGGRKVALVTEDLFALSSGMIRDATALLPGLGFSEQNRH
jgi:hypothetical protein